jgi:hypothetical protein
VEDITTNAKNDLKAKPENILRTVLPKVEKGSGRGALLCKGTVLNGTVFNKV